MHPEATMKLNRERTWTRSLVGLALVSGLALGASACALDDDVDSQTAASSHNSGHVTGLMGYYPYNTSYIGPSVPGHCYSSQSDGYCTSPPGEVIFVFGCAHKTNGESCEDVVLVNRQAGTFSFSSFAASHPDMCTFQIDTWDDTPPPGQNPNTDYAIWQRHECHGTEPPPPPPPAPPVARCQDVVVTADAATCSADASVDAGSYAPDGGAITMVESPAGPYSIGEHSVTLTVTSAGGSDSATCTVTVLDEDPPVFECPPTVEECDDQYGTPATPTPLTDDDVSDCSAFTHTSPGFDMFPLGTTMVAYSATDIHGNTNEQSCPVEIVDTQPPVIIEAPELIWRNNPHFMEEVGLDQCVDSAEDVCLGPIDVLENGRILSVTSDEPDGVGGSDRSPDIEFIPGDLTHVYLRHEREPNPNEGGDGRVYVINYVVTDENGNETEPRECEVHVRHGQGVPAVRGPAVYEVFPPSP